MDLTLTWDGDLRFRAAGQAGAQVLVDGDSKAAISPMESLLVALGSCMGSDIVDILRKGRADLTAATLRLSGTRREDPPRRFTAVALEVSLEGRGLSRSKAERAVELSRTTYCSVWNSMAPDIDFRITLDVRETS